MKMKPKVKFPKKPLPKPEKGEKPRKVGKKK